MTLHELFVQELIKLGLCEPGPDDQFHHSAYPQNTTDKFPSRCIMEIINGLFIEEFIQVHVYVSPGSMCKVYYILKSGVPVVWEKGR